jgi:hypothetical protein
VLAHDSGPTTTIHPPQIESLKNEIIARGALMREIEALDKPVLALTQDASEDEG